MARRFGGPRLAGKSLSNSFSRRGNPGYSGNYDPARETMQQALGAYGPAYGGGSSQPVQLYGRSTDVNQPAGSAYVKGQSGVGNFTSGGYAGKRPRGFIKF